MTRQLMTALGCGICTLMLTAGTAGEAKGGYPGYGYWPWSGYNLYTREYIPYFAQHPPVYYSHPVARPYGYSPYAYPPGVMTPEPEPKTVVNPYVPRKSSSEATERVAQAPYRIRNPYVTPAEPEVAEQAATEAKQPEAAEEVPTTETEAVPAEPAEADTASEAQPAVAAEPMPEEAPAVAEPAQESAPSEAAPAQDEAPADAEPAQDEAPAVEPEPAREEAPADDETVMPEPLVRLIAAWQSLPEDVKKQIDDLLSQLP